MAVTWFRCTIRNDGASRGACSAGIGLVGGTEDRVAWYAGFSVTLVYVFTHWFAHFGLLHNHSRNGGAAGGAGGFKSGGVILAKLYNHS